MRKHVMVAGAALAALAGCGSGSDAAPAEPAPSVSVAPASVMVRFELDGVGVSAANITMQTPTGVSQQSVGVPVVNKLGQTGLTQTFGAGAFVYFSAQSKSGDGSLTCRIVRADDGHVISENTSSGEYTIVTCKGRAE